MSSRNYIITSNGSFISEDKLFHGRNIRYIDLDPDELIHWKYIKRMKLSNGKYRYYYDESELKIAKGKADAARVAADAANSSIGSRVTSKDNRKRLNDLARKTAIEYEFKKITSFPARIISKGLVAVGNWLSKLRK